MRHIRFLVLQTVLLQALVLPHVIDFGTPWIRGQVLKLIPSAACREMTSVADAVSRKSQEIVAKRKVAIATPEEDAGVERDVLSTLRKILLKSGKRKVNKCSTLSESQHDSCKGR